MNKKRPKPVFTRGMLGTEDVDRLVEMINVESHDQSASDPKKAAKKARQKQKKDEEKRKIEAEEAERLRKEELERRLAEEQLERSMRSMKIGGKKKKKGNNNNNKKVDAEQQTDASISSTQTETIIIGSKKKTVTSRGVACSLIGEDQLTITAPWKSSYPGWEASDRVRESAGMPPGYVFQPGMPAQAMGFGQMHYPYPNSVERTYNIDALPHSVINAAPLVPREDKQGSISRMAQGSKLVTTVAPNSTTSGSNTSSSSKKKKKKNKQNSNNKSSSPIRVKNESVRSSADTQTANGMVNKWHGMATQPQNDPSKTIESMPQKEAGAKPEMVTIRRHPHYSDTTVTISMKNRQGAEDILYTLCNGQVVKQDGEPDDTAPVPDVEVSGKKKSKKKRNRKKDGASEPTASSVEQMMPMQVTTQMPPAVTDASHYSPSSFANIGSGASSTPDATQGYSESTTSCPPSPPPPAIGSHNSNAEIDLSRLKLPPGITITKVGQTQSADGSGPSGNMVRICNTGYFGQSFSITPTVPTSPGSGSSPEAESSTLESEIHACSKPHDDSTSAVSHSKGCNCTSREVTSCQVQTGENNTNTQRWQFEAISAETSQPNGSVGSSFAHLNEKGIPLLSQPLVNPFLPNVYQDKQRSLENRKVRLSSPVYGGSVKSSKRKQPRPLNFGSTRDQSSAKLSGSDVVSEGSDDLSESNSSYQSHALSLQQSLLQSQGRLFTSGLSTMAGDTQSSLNFNTASTMNLNSVSCSDDNS